MPITRINYGSAPDDGTGDPLRVAFKKTDDNFVDLDTRKAEQQDVADALATKVDKVSGKGLSTEDFTTAEKQKLDGVEEGAQVNPGPATSVADGLMSAADKVKLDGIDLATDTKDGLMSAADKAKLDGVEDGATANSADAYLLDRGNHTGEQEIVSISGLPVVLPTLVKADPSTPCIIKTSTTTLAIKAGTHVKIGNAYVSFTAQTAVTMPAVLTPGEDYAVFVHPDGTASAVADPYFDPAEAPVPGALKIGGFHNGLEAPGLTIAAGGFATTGPGHIWTQADVDKIAGINAWSIWDLQFRPHCDPRGMTLATPDLFVDIYLLNDQHITNGTSRYNTAIASGTVPPVKPLGLDGGNGTAKYSSLTWYEASRIVQSHKKRLLYAQEFEAAAYGVTENQSLGGASVTPPATLRQAGFTSLSGCQQATGHVWVWGANAHGVSGTAWVTGADRGQTYGTPYADLFGGSRDSMAYSGSRASLWSYAPWYSSWGFGARAACDRLRLQ